MKASRRPRVLITNAPPPDHYRPLLDVAEVITGRPIEEPLLSRQEVLTLAPTLAGIINQAELKVDAELLDAAPHLKIVANIAIGTDNLDKDLMAERGVWATNTPDAFTSATADCTIGLLLAVTRRLVEADQYVRSGQWPKDGFQPGVWDGISLMGKTLGIVGFGKIGQAVARRAEAFGMDVIFYDDRAARLGDPRARSWRQLTEQADVVSLHVPLTPQTRGMVNRDSLRYFKPGAILLNLSRGPVVVEADLIASLQAEHLAGAALDVFEHEPHTHECLLQLPNVVLTPHLGGGTREDRRDARLLAARNIARVLTGHPPLTPVNQCRSG